MDPGSVSGIGSPLREWQRVGKEASAEWHCMGPYLHGLFVRILEPRISGSTALCHA
jgi:hypothetical protein